jgi:carboxypeptidase C (cathepsin A)
MPLTSPLSAIGKLKINVNHSRDSRDQIYVNLPHTYLINNVNFQIIINRNLRTITMYIQDTKLRVIVYNGDTDPGLNSLMAEDWTSGLGIPEKQGWTPWTLDGKEEMGGYVTRYNNDFDFLTIRGSGHMVPQYKPKATYEFITRWIKNEPYQGYKKVTPPASASAAVATDAAQVEVPVSARTTVIKTPVVVLQDDVTTSE